MEVVKLPPHPFLYWFYAAISRRVSGVGVVWLDFDGSAAKIFINAVRNGEHGTSFGGAAERFQHTRFGFGIEVRGDFVQQPQR